VPSYVVESTHHPPTVTGFRVLRATEGTRRYSKERTVTPTSGAKFNWLERLPVTREVAASSPVAPASFLFATISRKFGQ
jgi:hypothetical protein